MISIGLLLNLLACVIWKNWWPFFVVVAYFLAPLPNLICARCNHGPVCKDVGFFLTGALIVSGFALPGVLAHMGSMKTQALFMGLAGGLVVYGTLMTYLHCFHKPDDDAWS
eukprot:TRINITY_DN1179_c0_g1_i3.p1 TRINITY_DN1179_c0_g1~~TRINITY_DN1179_c0_g1_i3.p1  ORF type:complete len:111 (-),score=0.56 TRINITY_DN1179_c0_g1_i3:56-388(-)